MNPCAEPTTLLHIAEGKPEMKLWLIGRKHIAEDEWIAFAIIAETEQEARDVACAHVPEYDRETFRSPDLSASTEVKIKGESRIILSAFAG